MSPVTIYAIDFGTSNSLLAGVGRGERRALPPAPLDTTAREPTILRSILFFSEDGRWSFGQEALAAYVAHGTRGRFLRSMKRFLPMVGVAETRIGSRVVKLEELVGVFLREMRERANRHYGVDVRRVLLGRPARFSEDDAADALAQERLERAARFAGFEEVSFCPEPVAAAYDFKSKLAPERAATILVADLGGGTSDFTVARLGPGDRADVLAIGGVPVAGDAIDASLMRKKIAAHFGAGVTYKVPFGANVLSMPKPLMERLCSPAEVCLLGRQDVMRFLRDIKSGALGAADQEHMDQLLVLIEDGLGFQVFEAIESTKRALSDASAAPFRFAYPGIDVTEEVRRDELEAFAEPVTRRILDCVTGTLAAAGVGPDAIDLVCATGGTARVPVIARGLEAQFGAEKLHRLSSFHSVIQGLAERARELA
jgi:hypothetical chaperone protein